MAHASSAASGAARMFSKRPRRLTVYVFVEHGDLFVRGAVGVDVAELEALREEARL
jgi:hypothetical protein